jgi:excisionase family DNA binding protein
MRETGGLSVVEAARLLGVANETVRRLIKARELPAHRRTHHLRSPFVVDRQDLEAYIERRDREAGQ